MRTASVAALLGVLSLSVACGARTGLLGADDDGAGLAGGGGSEAAFVTVVAQSSTATGNDGGGGNGEGGTGGEGGAPPFPTCDPDVLFIYLVTSETELWQFDPSKVDVAPDQVFQQVGSLQCPTGGSPFSMAVSRSGRAYSVYNTGELFRINVKNAACSATGWIPRAPGDFERFGMGYAIDDDGLGETLYVADITFEFPSAGLGTIDPATGYFFDPIGRFSENPGNAIELTSSDDGALYGYFLDVGGEGGTLVRIDKETAEILEARPLPVGGTGSLAFAYWNGDFYIFTGNGAGSTVTRYRPSDDDVREIATLPREIVGAGVTTCDPDEAR